MKSAWALPALGLLCIGCAPQFQHHVDPEVRAAKMGRDVEVSVPQGEIQGEFIASSAGASLGLIGALIDSGVDKSRASGADKLMKDVRQVLTGFDFDSLADKATRETLSQISWLEAQNVIFTKTFGEDVCLKKLDAAKTNQVLFCNYNYGLSPDCSSIHVSMTALLANKDLVRPGETPSDRLSQTNLLYQQYFLVVLPISNPSKFAVLNEERWAKDGGKTLREALEGGVSALQLMLTKGLEQTPESEAANQKTEMSTVGGYRGHVVAKTPQGTILCIFDGSWVLVLPERSL